MDRQGNPIYSEHHQVEIYLHNQYPQRWPGMKWLTPIWHPNINHLNGSVCIDAAWWTASRSLDRLVIMLGEMLQYKNYHDDPTKPPFPWDPEAARWSREYRKTHPNIFPVDMRELHAPRACQAQLRRCRQAARRSKKPSIKFSAARRCGTQAGCQARAQGRSAAGSLHKRSSPSPRSASNSQLPALCKPVLQAVEFVHSYFERRLVMPDVPVTIVLPSGGTRNAEVPDDVPVKELLPELTTSLELPVTGPDGRAMSYRLDSKALGRELKEEETLQQAGIPQNDRLMMTADVTAG